MKNISNNKNKKELINFFKILDYFKITDLTANLLFQTQSTISLVFL